MKQMKVTLSDQCIDIGWSLTEILAQKYDKRLWSLDGGPAGLPEEVVGQMFVASGGSVSYCEGGSALLLMKAAALEALARMNPFGDRGDAIARYLEAQMTILAEHTAEIVDTVRNISSDALARNVNELVTNARLCSFFPRVSEVFMLELFHHLGRDKLADILLAFSAAPYDYRAGWPDLIVIQSGDMKLIEVKTSDKLLDSQLRFARGIASPMGFDCGVVRLKTIKA
jgi:hypothetical protein